MLDEDVGDHRMEMLKSLTGSDLVYHVVVSVVIVAAFYLLSRAVRGLLAFLSRKVFARTATVLDDRILRVILDHVKPLMVVTGLHVAVREVRKGASAADLTANQFLDYGEAVLYVAVVVVVVRIFLHVAKEIIDWYLGKISADGAANLKMTLGPLTGKVANVIVGLVAGIIVLDHFGINIGSLLVSLGVGSLAVALAAQDTLANMMAGFVILADRPFRVGDRIELASGLTGDVQEIGLRSTRLLNFDNNLIIIPNADLVKGQIINHTYPFNQVRVLLRVNVAYGSDPAAVRRILVDLAGKHPDIVKDPEPQVFFTAMSDSSMEFSLMARASDFTKKFTAETTLREQVYLTFAKEGIEIPFPQRVVHVKSDS